MKLRASWLIAMVACFALGLATLSIAVSSSCEEINGHPPEHAAAVDILDGKKFNGVTGEKGKRGHHEDMLSFNDGRFTSSACLPYGFNSGAYTVTVQGNAIKFRAETISRTHGKMQWQGTLKGETLEVTYTWIKERWLWTTFREYWFKGQQVE